MDKKTLKYFWQFTVVRYIGQAFFINFVSSQNFHVIPVCFPHNQRVSLPKISALYFCYFLHPVIQGMYFPLAQSCLFLLATSESMKLTIKIKVSYTNFKNPVEV